jgi:lipopolysaccharide transport system ATP-binding protein
VIFVSHQMATIQKLCQTSILMKQGQIVAQGDTRDVIQQYLLSSSEQLDQSLEHRKDRKGNSNIRFLKVEYQNSMGEKVDFLSTGEEARILIYYENCIGVELKNFVISMLVDDLAGSIVTNFCSDIVHEFFPPVPANCSCIELNIKRLPLVEGRYGFSLFSLVNGEIADWVIDAGCIDVESGDFYGTGRIAHKGQGKLLVDQYRFEPSAAIQPEKVLSPSLTQ